MKDSRPFFVDQSNAQAGGDNVAGHKIVIEKANFLCASPESPDVVEQLILKLNKEIENNVTVQETIERLRHYYKKTSHDGINGLEQKLIYAGRKHEAFYALEKKELFTKTLEKWSLYNSAQQIFVYLLAKAEHEFNMVVLPRVDELPQHEVNELINSKVVNPIVKLCGASIFELDHGIAMGMLYWLAEQCFIRWHK